MDVLIGILGFVLGASVVALFMVLWSGGPVGKARAEAQQRAAELSETQTKLAAIEERAKLVEAKEAEIAVRDGQLAAAREEITQISTKLASLESQLRERERSFEEQKQAMQDAEKRLTDTFNALAGDAMRRNREDFLALAKEQLEGVNKSSQAELDKRKQAVEEMLKPINEQLKQMEEATRRMEDKRSEAYGDLKQHLLQMGEQQKTLQHETGRLIQALRNPTTRGQWGELQLRRVVEMAGMIDKVDFETQKTIHGEDSYLRPDMVIHLPNGRSIVVDSKAPLEAYTRAIGEENDELRKLAFEQHATQVRKHVEQLSSKAYQKQFAHAPDFVVMFLPGEPIFSAALERDPGLIETGVRNNVLITTPTTLIALLRAVAGGWRQEKLSQNAQQISEMGKELYKRLSTMGGHFSRVGKSLDAAVENYNRTVASLESRVLPQARKMHEIAEIPETLMEEMPKVNLAAQSTTAPELAASVADEPEELGAAVTLFKDES